MSSIFKKGDVILVEKHIEDQKFTLQQIPKINGGLIVMDPHNGNILAMMGGYIDALNQFNRVFQAKRQPGSILKTFGYLTALENGFNPASIIMDEEIILDQGLDIPPYRPKNYSGKFYGPVTLRKGLEKSKILKINTSFKRLFNADSTLRENARVMKDKGREANEINEILNFILTNSDRSFLALDNSN